MFDSTLQSNKAPGLSPGAFTLNLIPIKTQIHKSIGAESGLEPETETALPGSCLHCPNCAILHHFYTHTHVFTVKIRIII